MLYKVVVAKSSHAFWDSCPAMGFTYIPSCELQLRWLVLLEQNHLNTNVLSAICHTAPTKPHIIVIASKEFVLVPQNAELNRIFTKQRSLFQIPDLS